MAIHQEREEDLESLLNKGALWAVTYGDLMSYLMIFFLIMFTFTLKGKKSASDELSAVQTHFGGKKSSKAIQRMEQQGKESDLAKELQKNFNVKVTEEKIQVTLDEKILFGSGQSRLRPEVSQTLKEFAALVKKLPNPIAIEGHTDNVPIRSGRYKSNFELSMARAYEVMEHLIEVEGIAPERLSGSGYGEYRPVVPNDTPENRAQNRRIEINLIRVQ